MIWSAPIESTNSKFLVLQTPVTSVSYDLAIWTANVPIPPDEPLIEGKTNGNTGISYQYKFTSIDSDDDDILAYIINWDDDTGEETILGPFKSGFVAIIGAPNVGKSTLLNQLLGQKIAITSQKPQTTRHRILGVAHLPGAQLIFLDTPGIHRARGALNVRMVEVALKVLGDVDLVVLITDAAFPDHASDEIVLI